jgi:hypothetical protein
MRHNSEAREPHSDDAETDELGWTLALAPHRMMTMVPEAEGGGLRGARHPPMLR